MSEPLHILMLEDQAEDAVLTRNALRAGGLRFSFTRVETREDFFRELKDHKPDVILSDHGLPAFDGVSALRAAKEKYPDVPVVFVTGALGEEFAIRIFENGASDYVLKHHIDELPPVVRRVLQSAEEARHQRKEDEELRRNGEFFRNLAEGVRDYALHILDTQGRITTWNGGAERLEGYTAQEAIGQHLSMLYTPEEIAQGKPQELLDCAIREGRCEEEGWRIRRDGSRAWVNVALTAIRDVYSGELQGFVRVARDMTEGKRAEEQIRSLNADLEARVRRRTEQLENANRELEAFSYSVSHDLRAPLRHITGFVEILQSTASEKFDDESRQFLNTIATSARQMGRLIDDLLAFSRVGRTELRFVPVPLDQVLAEARQELRGETEGRDVRWEIGPLPEARGDPVMLRQVFINLLSNALKYSRPRSPAVIEVKAGEAAQEHIISVRDNGVGFDPAYAHKLFGVFQRLHPAQEFPGTGIGLAIVRRVVSRHGGRVWAEGGVDTGATFYFSLPKSEIIAPEI